MNFKECVRDGFLADVGDKDVNKAKELFAFAEHKLLFWKEVEETDLRFARESGKCVYLFL